MAHGRLCCGGHHHCSGLLVYGRRFLLKELSPKPDWFHRKSRDVTFPVPPENLLLVLSQPSQTHSHTDTLTRRRRGARTHAHTHSHSQSGEKGKKKLLLLFRTFPRPKDSRLLLQLTVATGWRTLPRRHLLRGPEQPAPTARLELS